MKPECDSTHDLGQVLLWQMRLPSRNSTERQVDLTWIDEHLELKATTEDGQMTDAELDSLIERLGDKKKPLDQVRDFSHVRQALKELGAK